MTDKDRKVATLLSNYFEQKQAPSASNMEALFDAIDGIDAVDSTIVALLDIVWDAASYIAESDDSFESPVGVLETITKGINNTRVLAAVTG